MANTVTTVATQKNHVIGPRISIIGLLPDISIVAHTMLRRGRAYKIQTQVLLNEASHRRPLKHHLQRVKGALHAFRISPEKLQNTTF